MVNLPKHRGFSYVQPSFHYFSNNKEQDFDRMREDFTFFKAKGFTSVGFWVNWGDIIGVWDPSGVAGGVEGASSLNTCGTTYLTCAVDIANENGLSAIFNIKGGDGPCPSGTSKSDVDGADTALDYTLNVVHQWGGWPTGVGERTNVNGYCDLGPFIKQQHQGGGAQDCFLNETNQYHSHYIGQKYDYMADVGSTSGFLQFMYELGKLMKDKTNILYYKFSMEMFYPEFPQAKPSAVLAEKYAAWLYRDPENILGEEDPTVLANWQTRWGKDKAFIAGEHQWVSGVGEGAAEGGEGTGEPKGNQGGVSAVHWHDPTTMAANGYPIPDVASWAVFSSVGQVAAPSNNIANATMRATPLYVYSSNTGWNMGLSSMNYRGWDLGVTGTSAWDTSIGIRQSSTKLGDFYKFLHLSLVADAVPYQQVGANPPPYLPLTVSAMMDHIRANDTDASVGVKWWPPKTLTETWGFDASQAARVYSLGSYGNLLPLGWYPTWQGMGLDGLPDGQKWSKKQGNPPNNQYTFKETLQGYYDLSGETLYDGGPVVWASGNGIDAMPVTVWETGLESSGYLYDEDTVDEGMTPYSHPRMMLEDLDRDCTTCGVNGFNIWESVDRFGEAGEQPDKRYYFGITDFSGLPQDTANIFSTSGMVDVSGSMKEVGDVADPVEFSGASVSSITRPDGTTEDLLFLSAGQTVKFWNVNQQSIDPDTFTNRPLYLSVCSYDEKPTVPRSTDVLLKAPATIQKYHQTGIMLPTATDQRMSTGTAGIGDPSSAYTFTFNESRIYKLGGNTLKKDPTKPRIIGVSPVTVAIGEGPFDLYIYGSDFDVDTPLVYGYIGAADGFGTLKNEAGNNIQGELIDEFTIKFTNVAPLITQDSGATWATLFTEGYSAFGLDSIPLFINIAFGASPVYGSTAIQSVNPIFYLSPEVT